MLGIIVFFSGIINKIIGGVALVKLGSYVIKNLVVLIINLNDFLGRISVVEVLVSDISKSVFDFLNWFNLVRKDSYIGACMINLGNFVIASGKKIIIIIISNYVIGGVNFSFSIGV